MPSNFKSTHTRSKNKKLPKTPKIPKINSQELSVEFEEIIIQWLKIHDLETENSNPLKSNN